MSDNTQNTAHQTCKGCFYKLKDPQQLNQSVCVVNPPVPYPMQSPQGIAVLAIRSAVTDDTPACHHYKMRLHVVA